MVGDDGIKEGGGVGRIEDKGGRRGEEVRVDSSEREVEASDGITDELTVDSCCK